MPMIRGMQAAFVRRGIRARGGRPERGRVAYADVTSALERLGIPVENYSADVDRFERYVADAGYSALPYYDAGKGWGAREKYLEHFVPVDLMKPKRGQVLIDIASMESPFAEIAGKLFGLDAYRQDLIFRDGIHGREIGGDAAALPVPDAFVDHMTLHCSFEHFEGDADSRFIREAERVLKPGGKVCILPLYTATEYAIQTYARGWRRFRAPFDPGDKVYVDESWGPPHCRFYDPAAFVRRVVEHLGGLKLRLLEIDNVERCGSECYLRYIALLEKPAAA